MLPGITRKSCIEILKDWGYKVSERRLSIDEVEEAAKNGQLKEMFGTGTAAVVSPDLRIKIQRRCHQNRRRFYRRTYTKTLRRAYRYPAFKTRG